jgi:hypothetical protein
MPSPLPLLLTLLTLSQSDPREHHHGATANAFIEGGEVHYLAAWSSSFAALWEHDIYAQRLHFEDGEVQPEIAPRRVIGSGDDGAQEPVNAAQVEGLFLTAWEDGTGPTVDVHAVLHDGRGRRLRDEWIVAGGPDSQHSAAVAGLASGFLVAYADEAPPAEGAMVEAKLFDRSGAERGHLELSPATGDNWWPVAIGDGEETALVIWGDGERLWGSTIAFHGGGLQVQPAQLLLSGIEQYHYQLLWLPEIERFCVVSKRWLGSAALLLDRQGVVRARHELLPHPLTREARPAAVWVPEAQAYKILYPTLVHDLAVLRARAGSIGYAGEINGDIHPDLAPIRWPHTGLSGLFAVDLDGTDRWDNGGREVALFVGNRDEDNDPLYVTISLTPGF